MDLLPIDTKRQKRSLEDTSRRQRHDAGHYHGRGRGVGSWDGQTLYYTPNDGQGASGASPGLFARNVSGGVERQVLAGVLPSDFIPVQRGIYYVVFPEPRQSRWFELRFLDTTTGKIEVVSRSDPCEPGVERIGGG